ncbi:hypothetical protein Hanom_Chr01g00095121 [Helianthus anomalus]
MGKSSKVKIGRVGNNEPPDPGVEGRLWATDGENTDHLDQDSDYDNSNLKKRGRGLGIKNSLILSELSHRDEIVYTQIEKSFPLFTLTVNKFFPVLWLGGSGLGWPTGLFNAASGGGGGALWAGDCCRKWFGWDGHKLGWAGVIRGVWVVNQLLLRGHLRRLVLCCVSGIDFNPGDIRKDQIGGLSLRCGPTCIPTPKLETCVGHRNQLCLGIYCFVGLRGTEGWGRCLICKLWWPIRLFPSAKGSLVTLGGQGLHHEDGNSWASSWVRLLWVEYIMCWKQCHMWYKCCQPTKCYCYRERINEAGNMAVVIQGYFRQFSGCYKVFGLFFIHLDALFSLLRQLGRLLVYRWDSRGDEETCFSCMGWDLNRLLGLCGHFKWMTKGYSCSKDLVLLCGLFVSLVSLQGMMVQVRGLILACQSQFLWPVVGWQLDYLANGLNVKKHMKPVLPQRITNYGPGLYLLAGIWANRWWRAMLWMGIPQMGLLASKLMKAQSVGNMMLVHKTKAWAGNLFRAWDIFSWVFCTLGWGSYKISCVACVYGLVRMSPQPLVAYGFVNCRSGIHIPCNARFLCIPSVGSMVSYFWSPKHVSGDMTGGMPP